MPNRRPLREILPIGLDFVVFLGGTDRYSISDKERLRDIYNEEFRYRDGKKHPNFSTVLFALKWFRKAKVPSGKVRFKTLPLNTFDGLLTSPGYAQAVDKARYVLSSLAVTDLEKQQIEKATVGQANNPLWSAYRKGRITASNFGLVLAAVTRKSYPPSLFKTLLGQYNLQERSEAVDWGIRQEPMAKQHYTDRTGVVIQERGLFLSNSGLLGGSPDGTVSDDRIIEVKCPWSARDKTVRQAAKSRDFFLELDQTASLTLKQTHKYWHQIQGNLHMTKANSCDLVVWTPLDLVILPVLRDPSWAGNIDILETFYRDHFLPHILSGL